MNGVTVRRLTIAVLVLVLTGVVFGVTRTPSPHQVRTPGAIGITSWRTILFGGPVFYGPPPAPSESLAELRCRVSQHHQPLPCPDPARLAQQMWPEATQDPKTLYVALPWTCDVSVSNFNIEYIDSSRTLIAHCYSVSAWYVPPAPRTMGAEAQPVLILVLVGTDAIPSGPLTVVLDDRVEYLLGDDSNQLVLGRVTIS
jgi:hypothetical protein